MGEDLEDFYALVDEVHGLTVGSLDVFGDAEDSENFRDYCPDDGSNDPHSRYETNELAGILAEATEGLPEKERLALSLYYFEEFSMKEVGIMLGVNESRASQLHTKATTRLRSRLANLVPNAAPMCRAAAAV